MKQIILMRHGKVDIDYTKKITAKALQQWVCTYDHASLVNTSNPKEDVKTLAHRADVVLTSALRRAKDSAEVLCVEVDEESFLFNEAAIPEANVPLLKLKPKTWLMILRILLLLGIGKRDTSLKASKQQAKGAAKKLLEYSKEHGTVFLVGHGGMNWLIHKVLLTEGWKLSERPSYKHWGITVLVKDT